MVLRRPIQFWKLLSYLIFNSHGPSEQIDASGQIPIAPPHVLLWKFRAFREIQIKTVDNHLKISVLKVLSVWLISIFLSLVFAISIFFAATTFPPAKKRIWLIYRAFSKKLLTLAGTSRAVKWLNRIQSDRKSGFKLTLRVTFCAIYQK